MDLEKFFREDHAFFKAIVGDFKAKIGLRGKSEERHIGTYGLEFNKQALLCCGVVNRNYAQAVAADPPGTYTCKCTQCVLPD
ncbi:hypothetical protein KIN20_019593 [Parelaphostrongylus tenuis]|uniref:Uncharacterized protein n=1 Tax=Parelaphostrongylus tenuis TaxID=148309 RepID=A0AAD5MPR1_PARTN|nr:hypothetical protein KIN20_019593 [Parelaphostrongylus tenuis]